MSNADVTHLNSLIQVSSVIARATVKASEVTDATQVLAIHNIHNLFPSHISVAFVLIGTIDFQRRMLVANIFFHESLTRFEMSTCNCLETCFRGHSATL